MRLSLVVPLFFIVHFIGQTGSCLGHVLGHVFASAVAKALKIGHSENAENTGSKPSQAQYLRQSWRNIKRVRLPPDPFRKSA